MRIKQVSTLHWGGLPNMDYPFGAHTLLAGETGSGKTSLIDAIVAVMAGGGSRYSKFNIAQVQPGQSSKKSRRTLASYIVGGNGMGRFLRPGGAHGYVCVSWDKDESDGPYGTPFTALIGAEASLERETDAILNGDIVRILVRGHVVGLSDLMPSDGKLLPAQDLIVSLRTKYGTAAVRDFKSGGEYLAMLYAYLKGDGAPVSREEADGAVKAFVSAIAYRQPGDIDGLIRDEILDTVDNESLIQRLMETIREVNRLKNEAMRMEANIVQLEAAERDLKSAFEAFMDERMFRALIEIRKADDVRDALASKTNAMDQHAVNLAETARKIDSRKAQQSKIQDQQSELQLRINRNDVYATKKKLESLIEEQERLMEEVLTRIRHATAGFSTAARDVAFMQSVINTVFDLSTQRANLEALAHRFAAVSLPALDASINGVRDGLGDPPLEVMTSHCGAILSCITEAWDTSINGETGLRAAFNAAYRNADKAHEDAVQAARDVQRRVEKLKAGQIEYPLPVELFLGQLRAKIPRCNARVLCDVVEVTNPDWQSALEGYIGYDRFTILYDRAFETQIVTLAKTFRRENAGPRGNISVPQLSLAIEDHPRVDHDSIVGLLKISDDNEAEGYLKARYGRTIMVRDTTRLKSTRSGVMEDGWSTQGYRYQQRRCAEDDLVFGAEIRRRQRDLLMKRGQDLKKEIENLESRKLTLHKALSISAPAAVSLTAQDPKRFDEASALRRMAAEELAGLDLSAVAGLEAKAKALEADIKELGQQLETLSEEKGGLQIIIGGLNIEIQNLGVQLNDLDPKAEAAAAQYRELMNSAFIERHEWPKRFDEEITERRSQESYDRRSRERSSTVTNSVNDACIKLTSYNREALDFQKLQMLAFAYDPRLLADTVVVWMQDVWRQIREQMRSQRDTGLPERRQQCEMAERSFTSSFTTDFCATVLANVDGRDDTILALNNNLERINFGGDTYKLISSLRAEYEDYIDLFRKIRTLSETRKADLDLFNTTELSPVERDTLFRIRDLLLDEKDTEHALTELRRIADYRNYRAYDFERRRGEYAVALSKWGTGSGGESETPVYVIRVAVMASAFKMFSQQKKAHFRSIFMDEVFSTMDEGRTRRVLRFLKELGLQIACAAPTRSMAAVLDEFDTRINFSKYETVSGDRSDVNIIDLNNARVRALYEAHRNAIAESAAAAFEKAAEPPLRVVSGETRVANSSGS